LTGAWPAVRGRPPPIGRLDPPGDRYLRACVEVLRRVLSSNLIGAYLYSSAVMGDFVPGRSDVDVVAVVGDRLDRDAALALAREVGAVAAPFPTKGLDLTVVALEAAQSERPFPRVELKLLTFFGDPRTADDDPEGDDRAVMHFACCRDHGIALVGPPAREVFAPVRRPEFLLAISHELTRVWMPAQYTVLNACRDLRFIEEGVICSKIAGGLWALDRGYDRWLLEAALSWQRWGLGPVIDGMAVDDFVATVAARLAVAPDRAGPNRWIGDGGRRPPGPVFRYALKALSTPPDYMPLPPHDRPLVSCILVAGGDLAATCRSARWFAAQDYPTRELIVVAHPGATDEIGAAFAADPQVTVLATPRPGDLGVSRDAGCEQARGEFLALWADDAWYAPWRLSYQVSALLRTSYDTSAASAVVAWDPMADACWVTRSPPLIGNHQLVAATVCLARPAWVRRPFAARPAEPADEGLLEAAASPVHVPRGAHFAVAVKPGEYVNAVPAVRYPPGTVEVLLGRAALAFRARPVETAAPGPVLPAQPLRPDVQAGFPDEPERPRPAVAPGVPDEPERPRPAVAPDVPDVIPHAEDVVSLNEAAPRFRYTSPWVAGLAAPMVSCIMPTFNRRRFISQALRNIKRQDYPNVELVVIDDGAEPVADLLDGVPDCVYLRPAGRVTIGCKRNLACEIAKGEIVVQWDDDDWYGPHRISRQVLEIINGNADATGIGVNLLLDVRSMRFWSTREREAADPLFASIEAVAGGTLAYAKDVWRQVGGYPDASLGEDVGLLQLMADAGARIAPMSNQGAYVYIRHGRNSWRYDFDPAEGPPGWNPSAPPVTMGPVDLAFYTSLRRGSDKRPAPAQK
jgi:glycosyltransferase involved in cell wall biosynthesis